MPSGPARSTADRSRRSRTGRRLRSSSSRSRPRNDAERRAARWYRLRGYRILATNAWAGGYELDVVARRGRTVIFCEVKSKSATRYGDPLEMVTAEKVRRVRRAAEAWLSAHNECRGLRVRFDVVVERAGHLEQISHAF